MHAKSAQVYHSPTCEPLQGPTEPQTAAGPTHGPGSPGEAPPLAHPGGARPISPSGGRPRRGAGQVSSTGRCNTWSRSSCSSRFSLRSRPSSSRSTVVSAPDLPFVRSACARAAQARRADCVRSKSLATAPADLPSSRTSRTAPAQNSSLKIRRARRPPLFSMLDIVSAFRKMSTKTGQSQ